MIYIRKLLTDKQLEDIQKLIPKLSWEDGMISATSYSKDTKNLDQSIYCHNHEKISSIIFNSLDDDTEFVQSTLALNTSNPLVSRLRKGNYYRPHHDHYQTGDYSTTLFLSNPDEYEGGELNIRLEKDDYRKIKLPAGHAITYDTGTAHTVSEVTSGVRYAGVFWTKSSVRDPLMRKTISSIKRANSLLKPIAKDITEVYDDPHFILDEITMDLMRQYADDR